MKKMTFDPSQLETPVTVLFDSSNVASAHEIEFLKTKNTDGQLEFVDLSASTDRAADYGVSVEVVEEQMQARGSSGSASVDVGFLSPAYATRKGVSFCATGGYSVSSAKSRDRERLLQAGRNFVFTHKGLASETGVVLCAVTVADADNRGRNDAGGYAVCRHCRSVWTFASKF